MLVDEYVTAFDDVPLYTLRNLRSIMNSGFAGRAQSTDESTSSGSESTDVSTPQAASPKFTAAQCLGFHYILSSTQLPGSADDLENCPELLCARPDTEEVSVTHKKSKKKRLPPVQDLKQHRAAFDGAWQAFIAIRPLPRGTSLHPR